MSQHTLEGGAVQSSDPAADMRFSQLDTVLIVYLLDYLAVGQAKAPQPRDFVVQFYSELSWSQRSADSVATSLSLLDAWPCRLGEASVLRAAPCDGRPPRPGSRPLLNPGGRAFNHVPRGHGSPGKLVAGSAVPRQEVFPSHRGDGTPRRRSFLSGVRRCLYSCFRVGVVWRMLLEFGE